MSNNLIIGAGAVGTVLAAYLSQAKRELRMAIRPEDVDALSGTSSLRVSRVTGRPPLLCDKPALTTNPTPDANENVFICVKHRDLDALYASLPASLPAGVTLIPCLNGVGIARELRQRYPGTRVSAMTIMFNAQLLEPLHARMTTKPRVLLNSGDRKLLELFDHSGLRVLPAEDESLAWGKLLINQANAICALTHTSFKDLLTESDMTACYAAMLDEATAVLQAAAIGWKLPVSMPYRAYRTLLRHGGPVLWWFAKYGNGLSSASYPSMVADVERGQKTEVDQLNGEIVRLAEALGRDAPINRRVVSMVQAIEGEPQDYFLSPAALRARLTDLITT